MDVVVYALCKKLIKDAIDNIGTVFNIKGNVFSYDDLPATGNKNGDVYLVGPKLDGSYDEYYWSALNKWESMGSTQPDMSHYITDITLYLGLDETGSPSSPAEGTILYTVTQMIEENYVKKQDGYSLVEDSEIEKLANLPADAISAQDVADDYVSKQDYELEYI